MNLTVIYDKKLFGHVLQSDTTADGYAYHQGSVPIYKIWVQTKTILKDYFENKYSGKF